MSLAIDIDRVTAVLLADGWHQVEEESFVLDSYEYVYRTEYDAGFLFKTTGGDYIAGPLSAIQAVRYTRT